MDVEELKERVSRDLRTLAELTGAKAHLWMLVDEEEGASGACSPSLKDFEWTLKEVVRSAAGVRFRVVDEASQGLRKADCLKALVETKHVELHPIVAALIKGLNELNENKVPRTKALTDPSTVPSWFPRFPNFAKLYAERVQGMGLDELFPVMDAIFDHLRTWDLAKLRKLRTMLFQQTWHPLAHSVGNWAGLRCYFDALEAEATQRGGGNGGEDGGGKPGFGAAAGLDATHGNADALGDVKAEQDVGGSGNVIGVRAPVSRKPGKKRARKGHSLGLQVPPSNQLNGTRGWQNEIRTLPLGNEEPPAPRSGLTETVSAGERSPGAEVNSVGFDKLVFGASGVQPTGPAHPPGAAFAPFELWGQETMEMLDMDLGQQGPSETQLRAEDVHFGLERMDSLSVLLEQGPLPDLEETLNGPSATLDDACAFDFGAPVRAVRVEEGQLSQDGEFRWLLPLDQIQVPAPGAFDTATYNPSAGAWYVDEQTGSGLRNGGRNPTASGMPRRNERNELLDAAAPFLPPRETAPADQTGFQPVPLEQRLADILRSRGAAPVPVGSRGSAPPWPESGGATTPSPTFQRTNARNARQGLAPPVELRSLQPGRRAAPSLSPATSLVNRKPEGAPPKRGILVPAGFRIPRLLLRGVEFFSVKGPDKGKRGVRLPPTPNRAQSAPVGSELRSPGSGPHRRRASTGTGTIPPTEGTRSWGQEKSESFPVPRIPGPRNVDKQNGGPDSPVERATLQDRAHSAPAGLEFLQPKPPQTRLIQSGPDPERASAGVGITPSPGAKYTGGRGRSEPFPVPRSPVPSAHVKAEPSVERAQAEPKASGKPPVRRELPQEQGFRRENVNAPLAGGGAFADGVSGGVQIPRTTGVQDRPPPRGPAQTLSTSGPRDGVRAGVLTVLAASDGVPASVPVPRAIRSVPLVSRADGTAELGPASSSDGTDAAHVRPDPVADGTNGSLEGTGAESDGADGGGDETDNDSDAKSADGEESVGDASDFADGAENTEGCGCTDGEASQDAVEVSDDADDSAAALGATGEREAHANEPDSAGDLGTFPRAARAATGPDVNPAREPHRAEEAAGREKARDAKLGPRANGFVPGVPGAAATGPPPVKSLEARIVEKERRAVQLDAVVALLEERMAALWTSARALSHAIGPAETDCRGTPTSVLQGHPTARSAGPVTMQPLGQKHIS